MAGLDFPLEGFVSEVLRRFEIQLHQLTPNAFACLSVFAMAMKMLGHVPLADLLYASMRPNSEGAKFAILLLARGCHLNSGPSTLSQRRPAALSLSCQPIVTSGPNGPSFGSIIVFAPTLRSGKPRRMDGSVRLRSSLPSQNGKGTSYRRFRSPLKKRPAAGMLSL